MIDGLGICADGDVWSVLLKCNRPIEQVRTVRPDPASRTSNALARILLQEHFNLSIEMEHVSAAGPVDAEVVIGDPALNAPVAPCGDYDLAELWKSMTGLPFVFAVWAHLSDHPAADELAKIAHAAKAAGCAAIDELAAIHAEKLGISTERCSEYLTSAVRYDVGPREIEAMRLFQSLLAKTGAILPEESRSERT
jgi:predicted solute-binding protein